jgi:hypothetical protein
VGEQRATADSSATADRHAMRPIRLSHLNAITPPAAKHDASAAGNNVRGYIECERGEVGRWAWQCVGQKGSKAASLNLCKCGRADIGQRS